MPSLPIESVLKQLQSNLLCAPQVVLQAPPGAGKSTFLPYTMIKDNWFSGNIIMLEPRRLAAKNIAYYLSSLFAEPVGNKVGYRMRGDNKSSPQTRLTIVTEGVLTRILQSDPELTGVDLLIFDEFHERNIQGDLGLALALDVQAGLREDLKILVMSATLDNEQLQTQLPEALFVSSQGRSYPVEYIYQNFLSKQTLLIDLCKLTQRAYHEQDGNILVFVAGIKEIKQCESLLNQYFSALNEPVLISPLYGALTLIEQQKAIENCATGLRKIVIATNIAETSLTIDGISVVVDSGFEREMSYQAQSGVGKLHTQRISKASATQRAGRAGRITAGTCYRLWSPETPLNKQASAQIMRSDLTSLMLEIVNWGVNDHKDLNFITQPPKHHIETAKNLLRTFSAIDEKGRCTQHGQAIIKLGVDPRLGHLILTAMQIEKDQQLDNLSELACLLVAQLESNERVDDDIEICLRQPSQQVKRQQSLLLKKCHVKKTTKSLPFEYCGLLLAIAFPDRIAQARSDHDGVYLLSNGLGSILQKNSNLIANRLLVVADLAMSEQAVNSLIYQAAALDLAILEKFLPHYFSHQDVIYWSIKKKRLIAEKRYQLGQLLITKQPIQKVTEQQKSQALIAGIEKSGLSLLHWSEQNAQLLTRLRYASLQINKSNYPIEFPDFSEQVLVEELGLWLAPFLNGITRPEQLQKVDLSGALLARLPWDMLATFKAFFPTSLKVASGSTIKLSYRDTEVPVLSVRMQELFGQQETPSIFEGRIKLQLALLSPARRPLQLTQDLATFWAGAYNDVKKEMRGRYPKHYWPDNPVEAVATTRSKKHINKK